MLRNNQKGLMSFAGEIKLVIYNKYVRITLQVYSIETELPLMKVRRLRILLKNTVSKSSQREPQYNQQPDLGNPFPAGHPQTRVTATETSNTIASFCRHLNLL